MRHLTWVFIAHNVYIGDISTFGKQKHVNVTVPTAAVENGETDAGTVETWEQKGEPDEEEPGGGTPVEIGCCGDEAQDEMMEEDEEMPTPKLPPPDAPKKEHVNVVFIGHVGMFVWIFNSMIHRVM